MEKTNPAHRTARRHAFVLLASILVWPLSSWCQVDTGVITGVVRDVSGAVVSDARVAVSNTETNYRLQLTTNTEGLYVSPPLPSGRYRIEVSRPGFRTAAKELPLAIGERPSVNFDLEIGSVSENVTVQEIAPVLQTENATLSTVRSQQEVESLPIDGRNFAELVRFTAGAVPGQANKQNLALSQQRGNVSDEVNGSSFGDNNFLVDGLQNNNNHQGWGLINYPELEAIDQYTIETSVPDARFGRSGATVNVTYKSGTDQFHGDVFEYLRNSDMDAKNFFATTGQPALKRNDYGGIFSGPLVHKDAHTFFFLSYEGQRSSQGLTFLSTVPTAQMRNGDFSQLLSIAKPLVIYNPTTTQVSASGAATRSPFANNQIPASLFNSAAIHLIDLYPSPNLPGVASNYVLAPVNTTANDQGSVKIDHDFGDASRAFFRFTRAYTGDVNARALGPQATPFVGVSIPVLQGVLSYTHIFSPHLINQTRFGLSREAIRSEEIGVTDTATQFGIPNVNVDQLTLGLPIITATGLTAEGAMNSNPAIIVSQNTQWGDNLDWVKGDHSIKTGFDVVFRQSNVYQSTQSRGEFDFTTLYTNNPASTAASGFGAADLLLGKPQTVLLSGLVGTRGLRRSDWSWYIQDDWKFSSKLTLNIGLRYELPLGYPDLEVANRMSQFDFSTGLAVPVNQGNFPWRTGAPTDFKCWAPRAGVAYQVKTTTVIRAAYGIYYSLEPFGIGTSLAENPPYFLSTTVANSQTDFTDARALTDGPLRTEIPNAPGQNYQALSSAFRVPYVQEWNLAVQQQLPGQQQLTVAYVGTKGTALTANVGGQIAGVNLNQAVPGAGAVNSRRRWPNDATVAYYTNGFGTFYHALQATLVKRWANSLQYQLAYTYSHLIDNLDPTDLNQTNLAGARGNADYDIRQQFRGTFSYELPVGRGKRFLPNTNRVLDGILGGWQLNGVLTFYTGFPFSVIAGSNTLNIGENAFANRIGNGNLPSGQRTLQDWFNLAAFSNPGFEQWGNAGRNILTGPGTKQLDASIFKFFTITEHKQLQLRAEFFNITNTPQFDPPNNTIGSPSSGQITAAGSDLTLQRTERQVQLAMKFIF